MTVTYAPVSDGLKISVDVTWDTGAPQHWEMSGKYDGKDYPITGNPMADMASFKLVNDHTGESTFKKDGKVTATNTRVLSKDGKTLTITSKGTTADGKPRSTCRSSRSRPRRSNVAPDASGAARRHSRRRPSSGLPLRFLRRRIHPSRLNFHSFRPAAGLSRTKRRPLHVNSRESDGQ